MGRVCDVGTVTGVVMVTLSDIPGPGVSLFKVQNVVVFLSPGHQMNSIVTNSLQDQRACSLLTLKLKGFPGGSLHLQCGRPGFDPWVRKILLEKRMATHSSVLA